MWLHSWKRDPYFLLRKIQAFTALSPSNAPIQSATLPLRACPEASAAQKFLHRGNTPQYHFHWFYCCVPQLSHGPGREHRLQVSPLVRFRNQMFSNGRCLQSHYLATGLQVTILFGEEYKLWSSSSSTFFHFTITSSVLGHNIPFNTASVHVLPLFTAAECDSHTEQKEDNSSEYFHLYVLRSQRGRQTILNWMPAEQSTDFIYSQLH
jgi:hypothetical protein